MTELNFVTPIRGRKNIKDDIDVTIRIGHSGRNRGGEERRSVAIRFYGDAIKKVCSDTEYLTFTLPTDGRIYFRSASLGTDFKTVRSRSGKATEIKCGSFDEKTIEIWQRFVAGNYKLEFDNRVGLYCVNVREKK